MEDGLWNTQVATGAGFAFDHSFAAGDAGKSFFVQYWVDADGNGAYDASLESTYYSKTFDVLAPRVFELDVEYSTKIAGSQLRDAAGNLMTDAAGNPIWDVNGIMFRVQENLREAAALAMRKDGATDFRAPLQFKLDSLILIAEPPLVTPADAMAVADRPNSDVVFVNNLQAAYPNTYGVTFGRDFHRIVIDWTFSSTGGVLPNVITHEIGHGTDVDKPSHINWETNALYQNHYVMTQFPVANSNQFTRTDVTRYLD